MTHIAMSTRALYAGVSGTLLTILLMGGCDGNAGNGGAGGQPPADAGLAATLCPAACAAAKTCMLDRLEPAGCEAQCALELEGQGTLIAEIALEYFQILADRKDDTDCWATLFGKWQIDPTDISGYQIDVEHPEVLTECVDVMLPCFGPPREATEGGCFFSFYRYNEAQRQKVRGCFDKACAQELSDCMCNQQLPGHPWIAVAPEPPDPNWPQETCPPAQ